MASSDHSFLHIADLHHRSKIWGSIPTVVGDSHMALQKISTMCRDKQIKTLVLSGDVFDSTKPEASAVVEVVEFCNQFENVLYIEGTHDRTTPPWLDLCTSATHLSNQPTEINGTIFYGIDYKPTRDQLLESLRVVSPLVTSDLRSNKPVYLILHNAFRHLLNFEGAWKVCKDDIEQMFGGNLRVIVGDVHTRETIKLSGDGYIHSAGPVVPQDFGQTLQDCFVDIIDQVKNTITPFCTNVRRFYKLSDVSNFVDDPLDLPSVIRLVYPPGSRDIGTVEVPNCIVVPIIESVQGVDSDSDVVQGTPNHVMSIEEAIRKEFKDPQLSDMLVEMYNSPDPEKYISDVLDFHKVVRR